MIEVHAHVYSLHPDMMGDCNENLEMQICQLCGAGFRTSKFATKLSHCFTKYSQQNFMINPFVDLVQLWVWPYSKKQFSWIKEP